MGRIFCGSDHIATTLAHLQEAGRGGSECVVLWLARPCDTALRIERVYRPTQWAASDIFRIEAHAMRELMSLSAR